MNILDLLEQDGFTTRYKSVTKGEKEYSSPCPSCGGDDRLSCFPERAKEISCYWCRRCNKSGDLIQYLRDFRGMSYQEACKFLSIKPESNRSKTSIKFQESWTPKKAKPLNDQWSNKASKLSTWTHEQLLNNSEMLTFLQSERGLNIETIKRFKIGYNPKILYRNRIEWGLPEKLNRDNKQISLPIPKGIYIPCHDCNGQIVKIKVRRIDTEEAKKYGKYSNIDGSKNNFSFFGQNRNNFIIVESELDAILLAQEAGEFITAISTGSAANKPDEEATRILKQADKILISLDNDQAGGKTAVKFWLEEFKHNSKLWIIPKKYGKDHTEAFKNNLNLNRFISLGLTTFNNLKEKTKKGGRREPSTPLSISKHIETKNNSIHGVYLGQNILSDNEQMEILEESIKLLSFAEEKNDQAEKYRLEKQINTVELCSNQNDQQSYQYSLLELKSLIEEISQIYNLPGENIAA